MKRLIVILAVQFLLAGIILAIPAFSATEQGVTATVTPGILSVSVTPTAISYGTVLLSSSKESVVITATNDGNVTENLNIRGADAVGSVVTWTLALTAGTEQFMHSYSKALDFSDEANLTKAPALFASNIAKNGTQSFKLKVYAPTQTADSGVHTTTVTLQAVSP